jgi:hypothetical protein
MIRGVKQISTSEIQTASSSQLVRHGLAAMALRHRARLCALVVFRMADEELALLPKQLQEVKQICRAFAQRPWSL